MRAADLGPAIRDGDGWQLYEYDPVTGRSVWMLQDGDKTVFRVDTPVQASIDENTAIRNATADGWKGDWHRVASVPMQLLYDENLGLNKALQQGDDRYLSRWLNDSQNRAWRVKEGNV